MRIDIFHKNADFFADGLRSFFLREVHLIAENET